MSLLMDALRRAEQAKQGSKEGAGSLSESKPPSPSLSELLEAPLEQAQDHDSQEREADTDLEQAEYSDVNNDLAKQRDADGNETARVDDAGSDIDESARQMTAAQLLDTTQSAAKPPLVRRSLLYMLISVVLVIVGGGGYLYYQVASMPTIRAPPPPGNWGMENVEDEPAEPLENDVELAGGNAPIDSLSPDAEMIVSQGEEPDIVDAVARADVSVAKPQPQDMSTSSPSVDPSSDVKEARSKLPSPNTALSGGYHPSPFLPGSGLEIRKKPHKYLLQQRVNQAYKASRQGDWREAAHLYRYALADDPRNRDALLGLAASAIQAGQLHTAKKYYQNVLDFYPGDPVAQAELINLSNGLGEQNGESRLKLLLEKNPEAAWLHFRLGNIYQRQGRWPEAQQAYFDAYRYDRATPDYAYNLAVSLDQLGKYEAALNFYQQSLQLAENSPGGFNPAEVIRRIQSLQNNLKQE